MSRRVACLVAGFAVVILGGAHTEDVVTVAGREVRVERASGDGLDDLVSRKVCIGPRLALAACAPWDVKESCCPAGCAAKKSANWPRADDILRGCMRGMGCAENDVKHASVFITCDCK